MKKFAICVLALALAGCFNENGSVGPVDSTDATTPEMTAFNDFMSFKTNTITGEHSVPLLLRTDPTLCMQKVGLGWVGDSLYVQARVGNWGSAGYVEAIGFDFLYEDGLTFERGAILTPYSGWTAFGFSHHPTLALLRAGGFDVCPTWPNCTSGSDPASSQNVVMYVFTLSGTSTNYGFENTDTLGGNFDDFDVIPTGCTTSFNPPTEQEED